MNRLRGLYVRAIDHLEGFSKGVLIVGITLMLFAVGVAAAVLIAERDDQRINDIIDGRLAIHGRQITINGHAIETVGEQIQALQDEIAVLEAEKPIPGPKGDKGDPGSPGQPVVGPRGPPGIPGKDASTTVICKLPTGLACP